MKSNTTTPSVHSLLASALAVGLLAAAVSSQAATTYNWIIDGGGEWGTPGNWNQPGVPGTASTDLAACRA
jgi:hypothetical protein